MLRLSRVLPVLACVAFSAPPAFAQGELQRARALFDEAGELERQGRWAEAQERLRTALRIRDTAQLHYALAWALENDDKLVEAKLEYETALRLAPKNGTDEVVRLAGSRLAAIERAMPVIEVRTTTTPAPQVVVDGKPARLDENGTARVHTNPGARVVRVERRGRAPTERILYVARGETSAFDVDASFASPPQSARGHEAASPSASETSTTGPWVLFGAGALTALSGAALFAWSASDASERDAKMRDWCDATACVGGRSATVRETNEASNLRSDAIEASDRGNVKQILGGVLVGVGVIGAGVGTALLVRRSHEGPRRLGMTNVGAAPLPGGGALSAQLSF